MTAIGEGQRDDDNVMADGDRWPATCRMLASAMPPIKGNNQLIWTVWGGGDEREGQSGGMEPQKRMEVELIEWGSIDPH